MGTARKWRKWKSEDLERAAEEVREGKVSVREAAAKYCIPKSMVHDHSSLKVKQVSRPGPSPVLTIEDTESCYLLLSLSFPIISTCATFYLHFKSCPPTASIVH